MSNIEINDLTESKTVDAQEAADVKGGPAFMKLGDIKGEATDSSAHTGGVNFLLGDGSVRSL